MKFVIAPDSFKGSLSAPEAARALASGLKRALPQASTVELPLADGGEGSSETLCAAWGGTRVEVEVRDPLGRPVKAHYALIKGGRVAVVEVAQASGLTRLTPGERSPLEASSFGTGELICCALDRRVEAIWVCLGGSATVDGGLGAACALGARGLTGDGRVVGPNGQGLIDLNRLDLRRLDPRLPGVRVVALCDVDSVLSGTQGARLFMSQKGATPPLSERLDLALRRWGEVLFDCTGRPVARLKGAGAAGGLGAGLAALLRAELVSGVEFILEQIGFEAALDGADVVVTGEGRLDEQTAHGKAVAGVAKRAQRRGVPVIVFCGAKAGRLRALYEGGVHAVVPIVPGPVDEVEALARAAVWLEEAAFAAGRLLQLAGS